MIEPEWQDKLIGAIDDFVDNPMALRQEALQLAYAEPPSQLKQDARGPIARYSRVPLPTREYIVQRVQQHLPGAIDSIKVEYRYVHAGTIKKQTCHADGCDYAGVVHLTLPEHCQGGTWFFRHRPTGHIFHDRTLSNQPDYADSRLWERYYEAPLRFNRLTFYPGDLFHAIATPYFGDRVENARLSMTFFVRLKEPLCVKSSGSQQEIAVGANRYMLCT
jgi:hypothetical protein